MEDQPTLLSTGVCMRVPFNRVTVTKPKDQEPTEMTDLIDHAGVSCTTEYRVIH